MYDLRYTGVSCAERCGKVMVAGGFMTLATILSIMGRLWQGVPSVPQLDLRSLLDSGASIDLFGRFHEPGYTCP